jgi:Right handed beta helix region
MKLLLPMSMLAIAPLLAHAAGGAYEINKDCAAVGCFAGDAPGFPITISAPGSYVLTSDILVTTDFATAIQINATPVDLDLNHHIIDGGGSCSGSPVMGCTPGHGSIGILQGTGSTSPGVFRIHDGTVKGFTNSVVSPSAIYLDDARGVILERLSVTETGGNCAIATGTDTKAGTLRLRDMQISRNLSYGICPASGGTPASFVAVIENSDFTANGLYGITSFPTMTLIGNRFTDNGSFAINGSVSTVILGGNTFSANNSAGTQYTIAIAKDTGGNACTDHACP